MQIDPGKNLGKTVTGLEHFLDSPPEWVAGARLGLLCNPASVDSRYRHARDLIARHFPGQLRALFAPQHGFFAEKQDNMIESADMVDPGLDLPVFSLYGQTRIPDRGMFDPIDVLLVDLQDVGTRVYTFVYTLAYCMEAARKYDRKVVVLDRPNPINGLAVEGNCLDPEYASFVGRYPIPMRHGLTIGELARLFNEAFAIGCDLEIVPLKNWQRRMYFKDSGLPEEDCRNCLKVYSSQSDFGHVFLFNLAYFRKYGSITLGTSGDYIAMCGYDNTTKKQVLGSN